MSGHVGHKYNPDPLMGQNIALKESVWKAIDAVRGAQTRSAWIREAIASALYYDSESGAKLA